MAVKPLDDYSRYPRMAHWFSPWLLARLLNNVILSTVFGQYADRRLIVAALDKVDTQVLVDRATAMKDYFKPDAKGAVWLDFVADLGDGFDSTYAMATLLARAELDVDGEKLPRGQVLIMGGDEVYPAASRQAYQNQLRQPYAWAFPDHDRQSDDGVPLLAIPGNHDWYDGLVLFLAYFCRSKPWHIGSWRASSHQRRSYFAIQITDNWWLWATDIQLDDDMDQPQAEYFGKIAEAMPPNAKIILCSAEPGWLYTNTNRASWQITDYAIGIAESVKKGLTIPVVLSGDTHHYSRYSAEDGKQFITSGGGGAFLHPTHHLDDKVSLRWCNQQKALSLTTSPAVGHAETGTPACYPSQSTSRRLVWRNLYFALTNWDFSLLMGAIYWIMAVGLTLRDHADAYAVVAAIFGWGLIGYTLNQERSHKPKVIISSALHAAVHVLVVIFATHLFMAWNETHFVLTGEWYSVWKWLAILLIEMGAVGFVVGGTIFGLNLCFTCAWLGMNTNDAFSAFRLGDYKNFLRIKIVGESVEIYAIGLAKSPKRNSWVANPKASHGNSAEPVFVLSNPLEPFVIEKIQL